MPFEALDLQSDENGGEPEAGWRDLLPEGVTLAPEVDADSADPARLEDGRRLCIALTKAGARCSAPALRTGMLCSAHAGLLDARAGGLARVEQLRLVSEEARNREITARLGTRAIVAAALVEKHAEIRLAIHSLADMAAEGDRQCALALIPWLNQGMGMPSTTQATPLLTPEGEELDLSALDTAQLRALLASPPE